MTPPPNHYVVWSCITCRWVNNHIRGLFGGVVFCFVFPELHSVTFPLQGLPVMFPCLLSSPSISSPTCLFVFKTTYVFLRVPGNWKTTNFAVMEKWEKRWNPQIKCKWFRRVWSLYIIYVRILNYWRHHFINSWIVLRQIKLIFKKIQLILAGVAIEGCFMYELLI